jgi:hypothetical protein
MTEDEFMVEAYKRLFQAIDDGLNSKKKEAREWALDTFRKIEELLHEAS